MFSSEVSITGFDSVLAKLVQSLSKFSLTFLSPAECRFKKGMFRPLNNKKISSKCVEQFRVLGKRSILR